jgi:hypothetical protein
VAFVFDVPLGLSAHSISKQHSARRRASTPDGPGPDESLNASECASSGTGGVRQPGTAAVMVSHP